VLLAILAVTFCGMERLLRPLNIELSHEVYLFLQNLIFWRNYSALASDFDLLSISTSTF